MDYSTYYYELAGFSTHRSYQLSCGAQALSISGVIVSWFIFDKFGRRPLIIYGMTCLTILNLIVAAAGTDTGNMTSMTVACAFMVMYNFFYNVSIGPLAYIFAAEVSSVSLRAKTVAVGTIINYAFQCMWNFVLPYMFNPDQANMGSKINFIFTGFSLMSIFVFYFYQPETAGRSFEDIDEMFAAKIPARKWKNYETEAMTMNKKAYDDMKGVNVEHAENTEDVV
ncbi:hypothetical protein FOA43_003200 [Brettanomyces nanus]|uniref:Major facilitator superfamily (MFS) profile domain-containing protein n=1 Tax=Eeniella nana TaxID=13502 RepID=A0A875S4G0_EENNA|nr:uncharacterized protein FOA43_003200 [Brettanomyces nanus]QPG75838.1 hypothetical protein FOA43_003200 [Brettanomyces nanus]